MPPEPTPPTPFDDGALVALAHESQLEFLREQARAGGRAGAVLDADGLLCAASASDFPVLVNAAVRTDPSLPAADALARAEAWFAERGRGHTFLLSDRDGVDDDLAAAAAAAGLVELLHPPAMVLEAPIAPPDVPSGVSLRRVVDDADLDAFLAVSAEAYGSIGMPDGVIDAVVADRRRLLAPHVASVVAWRDGQPLAAAQLLLSHGIGGIYWVGTCVAARGAGLGEAVTRWTVAEAFGRGAAMVTLQASEMGEPIYRRLGFRTLYRYHSWVRFSPAGS